VPSVTRLARVVRLVTLPETRGVIVAAARSETLRDLAQRAIEDRAALVRDLRDPANARDLVRTAARHPAARELANAGLMFLPGRYLPLGLVATVERAIAGYLPIAIERLGGLLDDPEARRRLKRILHEVLDRFMGDLKFHQRLVAALIITPETIDHLADRFLSPRR